MKTEVILDTNIFIYAYDLSSIYHSRSMKLFNDPGLLLYTTSKNITECVAVMSKLNYPQADIEQTLSDIRLNIQILYPSDNSVHIFEGLVKAHRPRGNKVFDLEVASIALANGIPQIATVNTKDFDLIIGIQLYKF